MVVADGGGGKGCGGCLESASYSDVVGSKYAQLNTRAEITRRCKVHLNLRLHQGYISRFQPLSDKFLTGNLVEYEEMKPQ